MRFELNLDNNFKKVGFETIRLPFHNTFNRERVDLRQIWTTEAGHFTPWLARENNLPLPGEAVGIKLELEARKLFQIFLILDRSRFWK